MFSSKFDCQIRPLERNHDWKKYPFMALKHFEKEGVTYCGAKPVAL